VPRKLSVGGGQTICAIDDYLCSSGRKAACGSFKEKASGSSVRHVALETQLVLILWKAKYVQGDELSWPA